MRVVLADPPAFTPTYDHELAAALVRAGADVELVTSHFRFGDVPEPDGYRRRELFYPVSSRVFQRSPLRRIAHSVRLDDGLLLANFHIGGDPAQLEAVGEFVKFAQRVVLAGDANIRGAWLHGYSLPLADSIDQILVRGVPSTPPVRWPDERRRVDGRLLSDHAPVELTVG